MAFYVEYYQNDLSGQLAPACGDRSVVRLDGRNNIESMRLDAVAFNGSFRPTYAAYRIVKGSLLQNTIVVPVTPLV